VHSRHAFPHAASLAVGLLAAALALTGCGALRGPAEPSPPPAVEPPPVVARPAPPPSRAVPRVEPIAKGAPNAPYSIGGQHYEPENDDVPMLETGLASWYGQPFHGQRTASGEIYDMNAMTAAHKTMPLPSYARVRNPANGREIIVRVNDRGPFKPGRIIDLSRAAAQRLGVSGVARVEVTRLTHASIRSGAWKQRDRELKLGSAD
jgi:rare lipoprotein A